MSRRLAKSFLAVILVVTVLSLLGWTGTVALAGQVDDGVEVESSQPIPVGKTSPSEAGTAALAAPALGSQSVGKEAVSKQSPVAADTQETHVEEPFTPATDAVGEAPSTPASGAVGETPSTPAQSSTPVDPATSAEPDPEPAPVPAPKPVRRAAPRRAAAAASASAQVTAQVSKSNSWTSGQNYAQYDVTIQNSSSAQVSNWSMQVNVAQGTAVDQAWGCKASISGTTMTLTPMDYARAITAGAKVTGVGLILRGPSANPVSSWKLSYSTAASTSGSSTGSATTPSQSTTNTSTSTPAPAPSSPAVAATLYPQAGALQVRGTQLCDHAGNPIRLQGLSLHGLGFGQNFARYVNQDAFRTLRDDWGANVIRLPVYTQEYGGWCSGGDRNALRNVVDRGVTYASNLGMYVIIDWHILSDGNPQTHQHDAQSFFREMSSRYKGRSNVLYEICNEPNGSSWSGQIRPYAQSIIPIIRANDPDAIVLVGTNTWCQDVDEVSRNPLPYKNVMYSLHFYAATHGDNIRQKAERALAAGTPLFVTESSICDASGNGGINYDSAQKWLNLMDRHGLSFIEWSLSNKGEAASAIKPSCSKTSGWTTSDLSATGNWYRNAMRRNMNPSLSQTTLVLRPGEAAYLSAKNTGKAKVTWSSDNSDIAGVSGGLVSAANVGTTNVRAHVGQRLLTCKVIVEAVVADGIYSITPKVNTRLAVDISGASARNGANAQVWASNGSSAQRFRIIYRGTGKYEILACNSDKALDVSGAGRSNGTNVQQYVANGTAAQRWYLENTGDGWYTFYSALSYGMVLDVCDGSSRSGANLQIWSSNGTAAQRFRLNKVFEEGVYTLSSALRTSAGLDISGASKRNGANVQLYGSNGTVAQAFLVSYAGGNTYTLTALCSGGVLDVSGAGWQDGTNVQQYAANGTAAQRWRIIGTGGGYYKLISLCNGKALDVSGGRSGNGTNVQVWRDNGTRAQRWRLNRISSQYEIVSGTSEGLALDVAGGSTASGANVQVYARNGSAAQRFHVTNALGGGRVYVISVGSRCALDVNGGSRRSGTNVHSCAINGTLAQLWRLASAGDGKTSLTSALSTSREQMCLDVHAGSSRSGANVQIYASNGSAAQRWRLRKVA